MPWKASDAKSHKKGLTAKQSRAWAKIANSALKACNAKAGGSGDDCEASAIRQANSAVDRIRDAEDVMLKTFLATLNEVEAGVDDADEEADQSFNEIQSQLRAALSAGKGANTYVWVMDVWEDRVVYEEEGPNGAVCYQRTYSIDANGKVELGDAVKVKRQTIYVPTSESAAQESRDGETDEAAGALHEEWLAGDAMELVESHIGKDGTMQVKVIQPGWGSSGYYSRDVLIRDGAKAYPSGTQMFWDHPTATEAKDHPERSLKGLAGVLVEDPSFNDKGPKGPGLYAKAKVFSHYAPMVEEMAPHIGLSIYGAGKFKDGEAEGRKGRIVEELVYGRSLDYVTMAGAGGAIIETFEAARGLEAPAPVAPEARVNSPARPAQVQKGDRKVTDEEARAIQEAADEQKKRNDQLETRLAELQESSSKQATELAREREARILREAGEIVSRRVAVSSLPDVVKRRVVQELSSNPPVNDDGQIDKEAYEERITNQIKYEAGILAELGHAGQIRGMGGVSDGLLPGGASSFEPTEEDANKVLEEALGEFGMSKEAVHAGVHFLGR